MKSWKNVQQFFHHILRGLVREYLPTLTKRPKFTESEGGSLKVIDAVGVLKIETTDFGECKIEAIIGVNAFAFAHPTDLNKGT